MTCFRLLLPCFALLRPSVRLDDLHLPEATSSTERTVTGSWEGMKGECVEESKILLPRLWLDSFVEIRGLGSLSSFFESNSFLWKLFLTDAYTTSVESGIGEENGVLSFSFFRHSFLS